MISDSCIYQIQRFLFRSPSVGLKTVLTIKGQNKFGLVLLQNKIADTFITLIYDESRHRTILKW